MSVRAGFTFCFTFVAGSLLNFLRKEILKKKKLILVHIKGFFQLICDAKKWSKMFINIFETNLKKKKFNGP